jgi:hypothetical protein
MGGLTEPAPKKGREGEYIAQGSTVGELLDSLSVLPRDSKVVWVDFYEERTIATKTVTAGIGFSNA